MIVDIRNKASPQIYSKIYAPGSLEEVTVTKDNLVVFAALKYYGLVVYNVTDVANPNIIT